jgi:preprotein translocase subunit SecY
MRTFGNQIQKQGFGAGVELLIAMGLELVILALEIRNSMGTEKSSRVDLRAQRSSTHSVALIGVWVHSLHHV